MLSFPHPPRPCLCGHLILSLPLADNAKMVAALDAVIAVLDAADNRPDEIGKLRHGFLLHTKDIRAAIKEALG